MVKVLVTGASGFIGSHLAETLTARGDEVTCLVRKTSNAFRIEPLDVALAYGDVTDRDSLSFAVAGNQVVYHLAGCTATTQVRRYYDINEQGVRNVAEACVRQAASPVLVTVSSLAAAGPACNGRARTEADPPAPVSHYGKSKLAGELAAGEFADRLPITIVRPPIVLGEADRQSLELFRMVARFGVHVVPALGRNKFSIIYVGDLVNLLILAAERGARLQPHPTGDASPARGCYFAAGGEDPTYADLGRMIGAALGRRRVVVIPTPPRAVWVVAAVAELIARIRHRPFYLSLDKAREARAGSWLCSAQTAIDDLGFSVGTPLADRLRQMAAWYRERGWI